MPSRGEAQQHRLPRSVGEHARRGVLVDVDRVADRVVVGVEDERRHIDLARDTHRVGHLQVGSERRVLVGATTTTTTTTLGHRLWRHRQGRGGHHEAVHVGRMLESLAELRVVRAQHRSVLTLEPVPLEGLEVVARVVQPPDAGEAHRYVIARAIRDGRDHRSLRALLAQVAHKQRRARADAVQAQRRLWSRGGDAADRLPQIIGAAEEVEAWRGQADAAATGVQHNGPEAVCDHRAQVPASSIDASAQPR